MLQQNKHERTNLSRKQNLLSRTKKQAFKNKEFHHKVNVKLGKLLLMGKLYDPKNEC